MTRLSIRALAVATQVAALAVSGFAQDERAVTLHLPDAGVQQIVTLEGLYVRAAYNNEGYVVLGYRASNHSVGEPWMVLDVGIMTKDEEKALDRNYESIKKQVKAASTPKKK
jgi:hypothetical protein